MEDNKIDIADGIELCDSSSNSGAHCMPNYGIGLAQHASLLSEEKPCSYKKVFSHMTKGLRRTSRDSMWSVYEALSSLIILRKPSVSGSSQFHIDLSEYSDEVNSLLYGNTIKKNMRKIVINIIDNAIPMIIEGKSIQVEVDSSEESIFTEALAISNIQSSFTM